MHDDFMSSNNCSLKGNRIPNQIIFWTKESLRSFFLMTDGLTMHGAKTSTSRKMAQHAKARCGKTGKPFLHSWNCPGCDPQSFPALRRKTSSGAPCRSRRQLPPTRRSPSRASQRLTMCQRLLSTPCAWNQAYRPGTSSDTWRHSSISSASFTTADDVSALSVDTLFFESSVLTERERQESVALHTLSQEDVGHVAPTRQSPPRAAQQLTTCQLCLSTPCNWNQAYRHNCLAGCIVNFMRTSGTPCRNRRHHTPPPRHAPRCHTM